MHRVTSWFRAWLRNHPLLAVIWVLFFALCVISVVIAPAGERPSVLYGIVILPLLAAIALLYMGRTIDRFKRSGRSPVVPDRTGASSTRMTRRTRPTDLRLHAVYRDQRYTTLKVDIRMEPGERSRLP